MERHKHFSQILHDQIVPMTNSLLRNNNRITICDEKHVDECDDRNDVVLLFGHNDRHHHLLASPRSTNLRRLKGLLLQSNIRRRRSSTGAIETTTAGCYSVERTNLTSTQNYGVIYNAIPSLVTRGKNLRRVSLDQQERLDDISTIYEMNESLPDGCVNQTNEYEINDKCEQVQLDNPNNQTDPIDGNGNSNYSSSSDDETKVSPICFHMMTDENPFVLIDRINQNIEDDDSGSQQSNQSTIISVTHSIASYTEISASDDEIDDSFLECSTAVSSLSTNSARRYVTSHLSVTTMSEHQQPPNEISVRVSEHVPQISGTTTNNSSNYVFWHSSWLHQQERPQDDSAHLQKESCIPLPPPEQRGSTTKSTATSERLSMSPSTRYRHLPTAVQKYDGKQPSPDHFAAAQTKSIFRIQQNNPIPADHESTKVINRNNKCNDRILLNMKENHSCYFKPIGNSSINNDVEIDIVNRSDRAVEVNSDIERRKLGTIRSVTCGSYFTGNRFSAHQNQQHIMLQRSSLLSHNHRVKVTENMSPRAARRQFKSSMIQQQMERKRGWANRASITSSNCIENTEDGTDDPLLQNITRRSKGSIQAPIYRFGSIVGQSSVISSTPSSIEGDISTIDDRNEVDNADDRRSHIIHRKEKKIFTEYWKHAKNKFVISADAAVKKVALNRNSSGCLT